MISLKWYIWTLEIQNEDSRAVKALMPSNMNVKFSTDLKVRPAHKDIKLYSYVCLLQFEFPCGRPGVTSEAWKCPE